MTSVLTLFEEKARAQPDAIAVSVTRGRLTYKQLDERAEEIGGALRAAGVVRESLVGVYLGRSPDLIASLLGVWKAGGAYLPIDPTNPRQRVAYTLDDSKVAFLLTERSLLRSLPTTDAQIFCVEDFGPPEQPAPPASNKLEGPSPEQLAYVIYTSGSTGRPKGAGVCHGGLLNVVQAIGRDLALRPREVALATATIAFDIANLEIYLPLLAGATVHLMDRHFAGDGPKLVEMVRATNAALMFGTPASWRLMLEADWQGSPQLQIITGGEVLPLTLGRTLAGMTRSVWNHYGPTETSICATREQILPDAEIVTLGWPIENVRIYVLDEHRQPLPTGETGEIYIGGVGVGRGYLNRPDLTEKSFVPDPFESQPGMTMYKTGDLGRLLPDGRLDFQGRADNQIKLRGFRIELEEIEAAIREYDGMHAAVVQVVDYGGDDHRLVAYFFGDRDISEAELREFLKQRLPFYMLPSELIPLKSLPMTANGKIDRVALNSLRVEYEAMALTESAQPPADDLEAKLCAIWQKLLKVRNISPSDDFFDLGGHSLLATRMFGDIERATGRRIPLSVLIQNPTVSELAAYIRSRPAMEWPGLVPIRDHGDLPPLFIAHGLGSNLLLFRALTEELGSRQPVYGIQLAAPTNARLEELKLEAFAARSAEEICTVYPLGPYNLAGHSLGGLLVFEIAAQLRKMGKEVGLLALLDCDLHVAQRPGKAPPAEPVPLREVWTVWRKKFSRLFESGFVNTVSRKVLYSKLMFKIALLRKTYKEGAFNPQFFGHDPYIAIFAERYRPQPIDAEPVLFVAEDELASEAAGIPWSQALDGRLEVQKVPGSHQTIFSIPNVATLAKELAKRLATFAPPAETPPTDGIQEPKANRLLEYHGG